MTEKHLVMFAIHDFVFLFAFLLIILTTIIIHNFWEITLL